MVALAMRKDATAQAAPVHGPVLRHEVLRDYRSLISAVAVARKRLGISQLEMDARAGLADDHTAKLERGVKSYGHVSLAAHLAVLRMGLLLVPLDDEGRPIIQTEPAP